MSKRKCTYIYALTLIFWKWFQSNKFNCILLFVVCSWQLHGLSVFNNTLPATILAKFTRPVLSCFIIVQKITHI